MKLSPNFVEHISARIVKNLEDENLIQTVEQDSVIRAVVSAITEDLMVEDRLNDEVRDMIRTHSDEMSRQGIQYHDMFRMIKSKLARERKLIL
jgi:hypothetical protein